MSYRPPNWEYGGGFQDEVNGRFLNNYITDAYEAGADAMLEAQTPLLKTVYAQLCGLRMEKGKTHYYSGLDESIDKLRDILGIPEEEK